MGLNLIDFFDKGLERDPARDCLVLGAQRRSYRDVQRSSYRIARALQTAGITPGTRVAVLSANAAKPFECILGALRAGCTWVPVNARNAALETQHVMTVTGAEVLFYSAAFAPQVPELQSRCPALRLTVCLDAEGAGGGESLDAWCGAQPDDPLTVHVDSESLASLAGSGGTTGLPKGVMTSHRAWAYRIAEVMLRLAHPRPVHLVAAPMTHGAGAGALELMALGATHVILPGFDAGAVLDAIRTHGVTHVFLPPTALYRLLAHASLRPGDYPSLCYLMCGGAPLAPERLREALAAFGAALHVGYGGTEFGGGVAWLRGADLLERLAAGDERLLLSCGRASPLVGIDVVDAEGRVVADGVPGEITVRGDGNASGYFGNAEETARSFRDGRFFSGDIGYRDPDGYLFITDRSKDMIISGGFNIYPSEIERVLLGDPAVQDCAVVGVPDAEWGEAVKAVVEAKPGHDVDTASLAARCREQLAGFKQPKSFEVWPEIPRSPVGKVLKRAVRERFWEGRARAV
jgi:acyl-CoA synthetase (AMP-forming)/AMP-acid ligase II